MSTQEFFTLLDQHSKKELTFEYATETYVPKSFHITEIKNVHIESVDCGGRPDAYDQTIVQLWVDDLEKVDQAMTAKKAQKIFDIVDRVKPINRDAPIFFEWGHADLRTSVYEVTEVIENEGQLNVRLFVPPTVCKPAFELQMASCKPNSGCC